MLDKCWNMYGHYGAYMDMIGYVSSMDVRHEVEIMGMISTGGLVDLKVKHVMYKVICTYYGSCKKEGCLTRKLRDVNQRKCETITVWIWFGCNMVTLAIKRINLEVAVVCPNLNRCRWSVGPSLARNGTRTPKGERRNGTVAGVYNSNISRLSGFRIQRTIYTAVVPKSILKQKPSILQTGRLGLSKFDLWCNSFLSSGATGPLLWQLDPMIQGNTAPKEQSHFQIKTRKMSCAQKSATELTILILSIGFPSAEAKNLETTPSIPWKIQWINPISCAGWSDGGSRTFRLHQDIKICWICIPGKTGRPGNP